MGGNGLATSFRLKIVLAAEEEGKTHPGCERSAAHLIKSVAATRLHFADNAGLFNVHFNFVNALLLHSFHEECFLNYSAAHYPRLDARGAK